MRTLIAACAAALALSPAPALAWGKTGHRVVAQIADAHLSGKARAAVKRVLGTETMAEASNWPDFMKSDPSPFWQNTASAWHYVTIPAGKSYDQVGAPPEGDAITALDRFSATLRDRKATAEDRRMALRFIIHIAGDLAQPLHNGNGTDRGGNDMKVTWFGKPTNLHSVWDSLLIDDEQLSFTELATWLNARITPAEVKAWSSPDPAVWMADSVTVRDQLYPPAADAALSYRYVYDNTPRLERQLEKGGLRLAAYLNRQFG
ncbi:S1/P1 nuclease [Sphingomonas sp. NPDC079357]|uniref:S1/P1 nuclease n=1 Tax=Sphingomonas sp. NPDC079357 TaxID=3364518 RepID=UPI00384D630E